MHWINHLNDRHQLFKSETDVFILGCKSGELIEELAETVTDGQLWGVELDPSYKQQLQSLTEELDNFHWLSDNPLLTKTYESIDQLFDLLINTLDLEPMKKLQADENALVTLRKGGVLIDTFESSQSSQSKSREEFLKNKQFSDLSQVVDSQGQTDEVHEQELVANFLQNMEIDKFKWEEVSGQQVVLAWKEEPDYADFKS